MAIRNRFAFLLRLGAPRSTGAHRHRSRLPGEGSALFMRPLRPGRAPRPFGLSGRISCLPGVRGDAREFVSSAIRLRTRLRSVAALSEKPGKRGEDLIAPGVASNEL